MKKLSLHSLLAILLMGSTATLGAGDSSWNHKHNRLVKHFTEMADEAAVGRYFSGAFLMGLGAVTIGVVAGSDKSSTYKTGGIIVGAGVMGGGLYQVLSTSPAEDLRENYERLEKDSSLDLMSRVRRGEGYLESLAVEGKRMRITGAVMGMTSGVTVAGASLLFDSSSTKTALLVSGIVVAALAPIALLVPSPAEKRWGQYQSDSDNGKDAYHPLEHFSVAVVSDEHRGGLGVAGGLTIPLN